MRGFSSQTCRSPFEAVSVCRRAKTETFAPAYPAHDDGTCSGACRAWWRRPGGRHRVPCPRSGGPARLPICIPGCARSSQKAHMLALSRCGIRRFQKCGLPVVAGQQSTANLLPPIRPHHKSAIKRSTSPGRYVEDPVVYPAGKRSPDPFL